MSKQQRKSFYLNMVKVLALLTVLIMSSCGMQGDLYLPEDKADTAVQKVSSK
ncbi:MAG: lipoprotein [Gammaproteobacteria bacterium]|nr:lipoprotein [Gammaproteobacteria bacterium]